MLQGRYDSALVIVSILVAILASYTALSLASRVTRTTGAAARAWLAGGATAMGIGIWSMHFIGMLSFRLPIPLGYDLGITFLSLVLPVSVSALALWQVSQPTFPIRRLVRGAILMGLGINAMHYTGMTAMKMQPGILYDYRLFAASVMIAIAASGAALWIAFRLRQDAPRVWLPRAGAAVVMGGAIVGMHYTGMAAANFPVGSVCGAANAGFNPNTLALIVVIATVGILGVAIIASVYDARLDARNELLRASEAASVDRERLLASEREARAQAEQINILKDEFLAVISHELRTPLNAILGWAQIIRRGTVNEKVLQQGMETIERNAHTQARLIEDLLDMSRIISGKLTLERSVVDVADLVDQALTSAAPAAELQSVRLEREVEPGLAPVSVDMRRMQQVLGNLLSNAIKFSPEGGWVRVRAYHAHGQVALEVADSGIGIDPEFLPFVFDRFRQGDASTSRKFGGLGLGLSIVKNLVQLHGGSVSVHSAGEGAGTTFSVLIPAGAEDTSLRKAARAVTSEAPAAPAQVNLGGLRVLVLDDVQDTRDFVEHLLQGAGATVLPASDAREALQLVRDAQPDLIVSDIGLPDMDGYAFIRAVRQLETAGRIPALALTAFTRGEDRQRAFDAGFSAYMEKPFNQASFLAQVAQLVKAGPYRERRRHK